MLTFMFSFSGKHVQGKKSGPERQLSGEDEDYLAK